MGTFGNWVKGVQLVNGYIEENNGSKYLTLVPTDETQLTSIWCLYF